MLHRLALVGVLALGLVTCDSAWARGHGGGGHGGGGHGGGGFHGGGYHGGGYGGYHGGSYGGYRGYGYGGYGYGGFLPVYGGYGGYGLGGYGYSSPYYYGGYSTPAYGSYSYPSYYGYSSPSISNTYAYPTYSTYPSSGVVTAPYATNSTVPAPVAPASGSEVPAVPSESSGLSPSSISTTSGDSGLPANPTAATVRITVPNGATVWVEGFKTGLVGTDRYFTSPPLKPGRVYSYDIKAEWTENGRTVDRSRTITVQAGKASSVDFLAPVH